MLNAPQVSFAVATSNSQAPSSQISLSTAQNWDQTLHHFDHQQKHTAIQSDNTGHTQTITTDLDNIVVRGDTLDRIPVFVNPHDLNQTNHASNGNQETSTNNALSNTSDFIEYQTIKQDNHSSNPIHVALQSQQPQITLSNTSTKQQVSYYSFISNNC